ncbi:hypothetical protein DWX23_00475 [Parabacteroides sp. AF18-52]|nr:hypothetical protein DWX23_00475 [Parabacteroides sp. AF18-52]
MHYIMDKIQLCDKTTCTQCMACVNACPKGCINMVDGGQGFVVPQIDNTLCVKCGVCMHSCHQLENTLNRYTPIKTLACWTMVDIDRRNSSSGGAFSVLARWVLGEDGVVFGATMNKNLQVYHTSIERVDHLYRLQGSKYVQSYLGDTFIQVRNHLKQGRLVLFTGTPCQIGGLLTYLRKKYDNLITCDMVCHGVPSQRIFNAFCERTHLTGTCDGISFRFTEGWGFQLTRELILPTKVENFNSTCVKRKPINPRNAWYMRAFNKSFMFNEACYSCSYAKPERVSDFTMADYWGVGRNTPFLHPKHRGVSMLLVNTYRACEILKELPDFFCEERDLQEALEGNFNLSRSSVRPKNRNQFIADLFDMSKTDIVKRYGLQADVRDYFRLVKQWLIAKR